MAENKEVYYGEYLQLEKILDAQYPESDKAGIDAHDEMLFIIIHQTYELWFKQILHELGSAVTVFSQKQIADTSPDLQKVVHRLKRVTEILKVAVQQITIMETMTPMDFLDFRNLLRPASGFQSMQFKILEAKLGLKMDERHGKQYYVSQLKPEDAQTILDLDKEVTFIELLNSWLERMPFWGGDEYWDSYLARHYDKDSDIHIFWQEYTKIYEASLTKGEERNLQRFKDVCFGENPIEGRRLSPSANRAALFIMLYREFPLLQMPYQLLNTLLDIDELMATWRFRHVNMVHRIIGTRVGTGGSTGKDYLMAALNKHYIFKELAELTSFLVQRNSLPELDPELKDALCFRGNNH